MERREREPIPFTSALTKREAILVMAWLPMHLVVLQLIFSGLVRNGSLAEPTANFLYYALGFVYMVLAAFGFLRRDFDPLADRPLRSIWEVLSGYCLMICMNMVVGILLMNLPEGLTNPNNESVMNVAAQNSRVVEAAVVYLAPVVEELMFRAGIFGLLRRRSRVAAYAVSMLVFALYHVAPYALASPINWIYLLQYLPVSYLLARCYERSNSIWCSILFHMMVNSIAFGALNMLQEMM